MTTLAAALTNSATEMRVNAAVADPAEYYTIDNEVIRVLANSTTVQDGLSPERSVDTTLWQIQRGHGPTAAASHLSGATLTPFPGAGGGAAAEGTVVVQLTGTETTYGHLYVGDESPEVDFSGELLEGDVWVDTSEGYPFLTKQWSGLAFEHVGNLMKDINGIIRASVVPDAAGGLLMTIFDAAGDPLGQMSLTPDAASLAIGTTVINLQPDGSASLQNAAANGWTLDADGTMTLSSNDGSNTLVLGADGSFEVNGAQWIQSTAAGLFLNLPTADPAVSGALWNDAGVVKVST